MSLPTGQIHLHKLQSHREAYFIAHGYKHYNAYNIIRVSRAQPFMSQWHIMIIVVVECVLKDLLTNIIVLLKYFIKI